MKTISEYINQILPVDHSRDAEIQAHLDNLTKPLGSLGRLEEFAAQFARASGAVPPRLQKKTMIVMAGDHGVTEEKISAFPAEVTPQMVLNFLGGGAAINVLARHAGCETVVVDMGVNFDFGPLAGLVERKVGKGTRNFTKGPAMTEEETARALWAGIELAEKAARNGTHIIGIGEMGIGNTTSATAMYCAMLGLAPETVAGPGTGLDADGVSRKAAAVKTALALHAPFATPLDALRKVGGFEIAGMTGVVLGAARNNVPVVADGFISSVAAIVAIRTAPAMRERVFFSHVSAERAHRRICEEAGITPVLDLNLRLGEGTGAALAITVIEAAVKIYNEMSTFKKAGVSNAL